MIKNNKHTPIGIFVYNRPVHTSRLLESLENCQKLEDCTVFIFSDGPKTESHRENVQIVRKIIHDFAEKHNASIFEESENLGIESSILKGISKICEDHCRFIVLEDDLVLHPRTIDFFLQALDRYEDDVHVNHISGFTFPIRYKPKEDAMILPLFNSWGWATWVRSWNDFEWEPDEAFKEMNKDSGLKNRMYPYYDLFFHHYLQKDMTWDLLWQWKMHSLKRVGVFPSTSLIWCSGFERNSHPHCRCSKGIPNFV